MFIKREPNLFDMIEFDCLSEIAADFDLRYEYGNFAVDHVSWIGRAVSLIDLISEGMRTGIEFPQQIVNIIAQFTQSFFALLANLPIMIVYKAFQCLQDDEKARFLFEKMSHNFEFSATCWDGAWLWLSHTGKKLMFQVLRIFVALAGMFFPRFGQLGREWIKSKYEIVAAHRSNPNEALRA